MGKRRNVQAAGADGTEENARAERTSSSQNIALPDRQEKPGVLPTDSTAEAGRKVILFHFAEMLFNEPGTRLGEDIEALHDMRVATRRIRAAFDLFGGAYKPKVVRRLLRGLRKTGRALGGVRDLDVFIENAQKYGDSLPENEREGTAALIDAWKAEREQRRAEMLSHLDSQTYAKFVRQLNQFVQTDGAGTDVPPDGSAIPGQVWEAAPLVIYARLNSIRAFEPLLGSASLDQLHALRIEFKKLRYALEFFREVLGPEVKEAIGTLKKVQDHLGELNDARVSAARLSSFLENWERLQAEKPLDLRTSPEEVIRYLESRTADRHRLITTFPETWKMFASQEFRRAVGLALAAL